MNCPARVSGQAPDWEKLPFMPMLIRSLKDKEKSGSPRKKLGIPRTWGKYLFTYEAVRTSANPDETLLRFLQSTYQAAATLGNWDRNALEAGFLINIRLGMGRR